MKKIIFTVVLTIGSFGFARALDCRVQLLYPKDGCGNCQSVDREFQINGNKKSETVDMGAVKADRSAGQRLVSYSIEGDSEMVHTYLEIKDKRTGQVSFSRLVYVQAKNGVVANLGDSSGLHLTLVCQPL